MDAIAAAERQRDALLLRAGPGDTTRERDSGTARACACDKGVSAAAPSTTRLGGVGEGQRRQQSTTHRGPVAGGSRPPQTWRAGGRRDSRRIRDANRAPRVQDPRRLPGRFHTEELQATFVFPGPRHHAAS